MIDPDTAATGRTTIFSLVEVLDHERGEWTTWLPLRARDVTSADALVQAAICAGWDDVRLVVHLTGGARGGCERSVSLKEHASGLVVSMWQNPVTGILRYEERQWRAIGRSSRTRRS